MAVRKQFARALPGRGALIGTWFVAVIGGAAGQSPLQERFGASPFQRQLLGFGNAAAIFAFIFLPTLQPLKSKKTCNMSIMIKKPL
jgi:hypothetical protein